MEILQLLPLGKTYKHKRGTVDRKFIFKDLKVQLIRWNDGTDNCITVATTDAQYENDEATDKYTHKVAIAEGGTPGIYELYI